MEYPESCVRGIQSAEWVLPDGSILTGLFQFDPAKARPDGWVEQCVNWHDDDGAVELVLNQRTENGAFQFKGGAAIVSREEIDRIRAAPNRHNMVSYERQPLAGNPYHGNVLLNSSVPTAVRKQIQATLALYARFVSRR